MRNIVAWAFLLTLACADRSSAGVVLLDYWRAVSVQGRVDFGPYPFFHESQTSYGLNGFQQSLTETSTWLEWTGEVRSRIGSDLSSDFFWARGYAGVFSYGDRHDFPNRFRAMAANIFDVTFTVDVPTPYEIYLDGFVIDSESFPSYTDVSAMLFGPEGFVDGWKIHDGQDEFYSTGVLAPGQYRFQAGALATLWAATDDSGIAEYSFYLILPEPATLLLLGVASPLLLRKSKRPVVSK